MSDDINMKDQLANARALANSVEFGLAQHPRWPEIAAHGKSEIACNLIDHGLRRLTYIELDRVPRNEQARFACGLAACFGEHIGRILQFLPPSVVQEALEASIANALQTLMANPNQPAFSVKVSDGQHKEPVH